MTIRLTLTPEQKRVYEDQLRTATPRHTRLAFALQRAADVPCRDEPAPLYIKQAHAIIENPADVLEVIRETFS